MEKPIVSIVIPTYNYGKFISDAVDSVVNQDYPKDKMEIIVIDDGSTDNTRSIIQKYKSNVRYTYQENSGLGWAIKNGVDKAKGKYIFYLDADDIFLPGKIKETVNVFENDDSIVQVSHPVTYWYMDKNLRKKEIFPKKLKGKIEGKKLLLSFYKKNKFYGGGSTIAARSDILKKVPIKKGMTMFMDEFISLFNLNLGNIYFFDEPFSVYRIHGNNISVVPVAKKERNVKATETILSEVLKNNFDEKIKRLYKLKTLITQIRFKEQINKKTIWDIIGLWRFLMANIFFFNKDFPYIFKSYKIIMRSMPMAIFRILRGLKNERMHIHISK